VRDGAAVGRALPGGVRGVTRADGAVEVVVDVALGAASGRLVATATALAPGSARIVGEGEPGGFDVVVRADPASGAFDVEGTVSGALGTVGSGLLAAWVSRTAAALMAGLAEPDAASEPPPAAATRAAVVADRERPAPDAAPRRDLVGPAPGGRSPISAARAGAALLGALVVGYVAGRRRRT
jgi:hypothetical protein